jgi:hypothetical protein
VVAIVDLATAMMFWRRDPKKLYKRVQELFSRYVVVLLEQSARNRSCWMPWTYGRRRWS